MKEPAILRPEQFLGYQLRRASNAAMAELSHALARFQLRPTLYAILMAIEATPRASQSEIGRQLSIKRANMVPLLAELEEAGWIDRVQAPNDRRSRILSISRKRRADLEAAHAAAIESDRALMTRAAPDGDGLAEALERIWTTSPIE